MTDAQVDFSDVYAPAVGADKLLVELLTICDREDVMVSPAGVLKLLAGHDAGVAAAARAEQNEKDVAAVTRMKGGYNSKAATHAVLSKVEAAIAAELEGAVSSDG